MARRAHLRGGAECWLHLSSLWWILNLPDVSFSTSRISVPACLQEPDLKPQQEPVWEPEWEVQRLFSVLQDPQWPPPIHGQAMTDQREQGAQQMPDRESPPLVASMMSEQTAHAATCQTTTNRQRKRLRAGKGAAPHGRACRR